MARRSNSPAPVEETPEVTTDEVTPDETPETPQESTETPAAEAPAEEEVDLTAFTEAVNAAVSEADTSTGDVPKASIDAVNKVYREVPSLKGKNAARASLDAAMKAAISEEKNIMKAKAFVMIKDGLSAGSGGSSTPRTPADPTQAFVQKVVALQLATEEVLGNVPEGVSEDWTEKADELRESLAADLSAYRDYVNSTDEDAEAPEVSPVVRQVFKLVQGRSTGGGGTSNRVAGAPRRDIEKHLAQVFADLDAGAFLTVNEIAKAASTEYGDDRPSAGAVSARLFPKGKAPYVNIGIKAVAEVGKSRGAVKL
jgi:hypothetical protein